jgi:hypothetical protein
MKLGIREIGCEKVDVIHLSHDNVSFLVLMKNAMNFRIL